jgi:hypothetical protein
MSVKATAQSPLAIFDELAMRNECLLKYWNSKKKSKAS